MFFSTFFVDFVFLVVKKGFRVRYSRSIYKSSDIWRMTLARKARRERDAERKKM